MGPRGLSGLQGEMGPQGPQGETGAFETLYRDPTLRRRLVEAARERIRRDFDTAETVRRTKRLYDELVPDPEVERIWPALR